LNTLPFHTKSDNLFWANGFWFPLGKEQKKTDIIKKVFHRTNRFIWQRFGENIDPTKRIISVCYYNRNGTETVLADKLKQASNEYYPSRIYGIQLYIFRLY
jgi:hypothetical protein